ncbi:MAG: FTR1 family protein [Terrimicrobiaceae bacterium]|nr:FTR1 family protein [Terrimicrobiaceae bacterium]
MKKFLLSFLLATGVVQAANSPDEVKAHLVAKLDGVGTQSASFVKNAAEYAGLAQANGSIEAAHKADPKKVEKLVEKMRENYKGMDSFGYETIEGIGAWLALAASAAIFAISRTLLSGLARYGEVLEAAISLMAIAILLMVTNWVFHKYYWTGWNARLRQLSKSAAKPKAPWLESAALVGVGFMTIFREGFETTLFMQSLILEAGMGPAGAGLCIGGALIALLGFSVFFLGAKLPYRKMLVVTGILVIFVLFAFSGSTVRILQTVGWLPIHPVPGLSLPNWTGVWLGLYPTFEGLLVPLLVLGYVCGAWIWVKWAARSSLLPETPAEKNGPLCEVG